MIKEVWREGGERTDGGAREVVKEQVLILSTEREEKVCTRVNEFDVVWRKEKGLKEGRVRRGLD